MAKTHGIYLNDIDETRLEHIKQFVKEDPKMPDMNKSQLVSYCIQQTYQGMLIAKEALQQLEELSK